MTIKNYRRLILTVAVCTGIGVLNFICHPAYGENFSTQEGKSQTSGELLNSRPLNSWDAEKKAVSDFSNSLKTGISVAKKNKDEKIDLTEIGKTFTASRIPALTADDFTLAGYKLGEVPTLYPTPYTVEPLDLNLSTEGLKNVHITAIKAKANVVNLDKIETEKSSVEKLHAETNNKAEGKSAGKSQDTKSEKSKKDVKKTAIEIDEVAIMTTSAVPVDKGYFKTFNGTDGFYTVYNGPLKGVADTLRLQGLRYDYSAPVVTDIHVVQGDYATSRHISIGSTRGDVLFAYGNPTYIWRDSKKNNLILLYEGKVKDRTYYQAFTLEKNKVSQIDFFDAQAMRRFGLPTYAKSEQLEPGVLTEADFSMMGYTINEPFKYAANDAWKASGTLYNNDFISYESFLVSFDSKKIVSRVLLDNQNAVTRRGISIGDTKYLMLYLYGEPTFIENDSSTKEGAVGSKIYVYKNPKGNSYLLFSVEDGQDFIKSIMLSDRTKGELEHVKSK